MTILIRLPRFPVAEQTVSRDDVTEAIVAKACIASALDSILRGYRDLIEAASGIDGLPSDAKLFMVDQLRGLHDGVSNLDTEQNTIIDEGGEDFDRIDLSPLDELIEKVTP